MRRNQLMRSWGGCALLVMTLAVLAGCASSLQAARGVPITDINLIAGKWTGTMTPGSDGWQDLFYLTITPDRKLTAAWGPNTAWGTVTLQDGKATYHMEPFEHEGTMTLYRAGARRTLVLDDLWSSFNAWVTPQQ
jgi:hypothetical protein